MNSSAAAVTPPTALPHVVILLGCFNGGRFLAQQLQSLSAQTHTHWSLLVSDDGSCDDSLALLAAFQQQIGTQRMCIRRGPGRGFVANFLAMACDPVFEGSYFAFCDQDDVWEVTKLETALRILHSYNEGPALYCSRTHLTDEQGNTIGFSPLFCRPPAFRNALVQSLAGGNTMLFNDCARGLLATAGPNVVVASHDWWMYLLVSGAGGFVYYDTWASLRYRQHGNNLVGGNIHWQAVLARCKRLFCGQFRHWNDMHCHALRPLVYLLNTENRNLFELFQCSRRGRVGTRLAAFFQARFYRQRWMDNLALYLAVALGKF